MRIIELPYEKKSDYINMIAELSQSIGRDGMLQICINNCEAQKRLYLIYENNRNRIKIYRMIKRNHLMEIKGSVADELLETLIVDGNDIIPLTVDADAENIQQYLS